MKHSLTRLKAFGLLFLLFLYAAQGMAQQTVTGTVTDASTGEALIGATILIKGTTRGAVTDISGNYTISASAADVLVYSYIGYDYIEETVGERTVINVMLKESTTILEDVVVIGYGTVKKSDLTGAVAVVTAEELNRTPAPNFQRALQGKAPGVIVSQTSGDPSGGVSIRVRGIGSISQNPNPIFVIDGVITGSLNSINPADIESLQVLKDASASAIYGADGANGVIIITTKRGKSGKPQVHYSNYFSSSFAPKQLELMDADQYAEFYTTLMNEQGTDMVEYSDGFRQHYYGDGWEKGTDWQKLLTQTGHAQNHYVRISGGGDNSNFSLSANYLDETGSLINNGVKRYNLRANSDFKIGDKLKIGQTLNIARNISYNSGASYGQANVASPLMKVYDSENLGGFAGPQQDIWYDLNNDGVVDLENPTDDTNGNGILGEYEIYATTGVNDKTNPVAEASLDDNRNFGNNLMANLYLEYSPIKWLTYRISPSVELSNGRSRNWVPAYDLGVRSNTRNVLTENYSEFIGLQLENQLTFSKSFGENNLVATAVQQVRKSDGTGIGGIGRGFIWEAVPVMGMSDLNDRELSSYISSFRQLSYLGRVIYDYSGKYFVTASIRRDGVSRFGPKNRWGNFPSLSLAWKVNEDFLQNVEQINLLKLRFGWGSTGNSNISDFQYDDFLDDFSAFAPVFGSNQTLNPGTYIFYSFANPLIKWEAAKMTNFGIDINAFKNKVQVSAEYYIKNQDDLLVRVPVSMAFGRSGDQSEPWANSGVTQNRGFEIAASYKNYEGAFKYSVTATVTTLKNEVVSLPLKEIISGNNIALPGHTIGSLYGWVAERLHTPDDFDELGNYKWATVSNGVPQPGDIKYKDLNNDGKINDEDRTIIGKPLPDALYSLNFECSWRNFDFSIFLNGMYNYQVYNQQNATLLSFVSQDLHHNKLVEFADNYYRTDRTTTKYVRADLNNTNQNDRISTWWIENASFLRVKDIQLGYTLPETLVNSIGLSRLRVYGSAANPLILTKYTGRDPENGAFSNPLSSGTDGGGYPNPRVLSFGVQVDF